jgi:hypothetical protein
MAAQYSVPLRNAQLDAVETVIGAAPKLQLRTGAPPADCSFADKGTLLCEISLPSDWLAPADEGRKIKSGTWSGSGAADGDAGHFRIKDSTGTTTHIQGTITQTDGGGDATMRNISVKTGLPVYVDGFTINAGNV